MLKGVLLLTLSCVVLTGAIPTERDRRPKGLSDKEHYEGEEHNAEYDHEAFLGKEQASEFDKLTHEEARRRLSVIVKKIDKDSDGYVSEDELKDWVRHVAKRYVFEDVDLRLPNHDGDSNGQLTLEEFYQSAYGKIKDEDELFDSYRKLSFKQQMARDKRRFDASDVNKDGVLDREEFGSFLHPHDVPHMRDVYIAEVMEDMDGNKDGYVTIEEYIRDIWPDWERNSDEEEPEWVKTEREQFFQHRDKNKDNKLSKRELGDWISPLDFDNAKAEASHLIYHADKDKDKKLTEMEILNNQDLFVGSQATDFGNYLNRHDEF